MIAILRTGCGCSRTIDLADYLEKRGDRPPPEVLRFAVMKRRDFFLGPGGERSETESSTMRTFRLADEIGPDIYEYWEWVP